VVEVGAGVRLPSRRCTPERLRAAVEQVLADGSYRENARRLGRRLTQAHGAADAAELLESLATGRLTVA
jgi:UDP:flavonoid glycosyltransferase YjiC (YdhE family)